MFSAWKEFRRSKRKKKDVAKFELNLEDNIFKIHKELLNGTYKLDPYKSFSISDPKPRRIHKARVRDRVFYQAVFRTLYPIFNRSFIFDSYSSRKEKGTHLGVGRLSSAIRKISSNWSKPSYALKCDIAKFFDSINHDILMFLLERKIKDTQVLNLLRMILDSFEKSSDYGIPLGNVTSQLFANVYLHELDRFVKHTLKVRYYFRYADDFILLSNKEETLKEYEISIREFLDKNLKLKLHENKVSIQKVSQGIDFLGYVVLPHSIVLRTKTKRRILNRIFKVEPSFEPEKFFQKLDSYLGVLKHSKSRAIKNEIFKYILENFDTI